MRTVELFPFVPTTWIAAKRSCGEPSAVSSRRMRSRPKRIPNSSRPSRCSSARSALQALTRPSRSSRSRASFPRSASTTAAGALATKPSLPSFFSARAISPSSQPRRSSIRRAAAPRSTASDGSTAIAPPGTATVAAGSPVAGPFQPRQSRDVARGAVVALRAPAAPGARPPGAAPMRSRQPRSSWTAAIARPSSASAAGSSSASSTCGQRRAISRPLAPGTCDQISSVTNGITGCAIASVSASTPRANALTASLSSAYRRGFTISRYQSHSSP